METCVKESLREWVTFENGGQKVFGVLHLPHGVEKAPVVVILHGFASHKVGTNRSYITIAENLAQEGIATFRFDFRGAGDSEGHSSDMTISGLVSDALCAFDHIAHDSRLDADRLGLFGSSLGGAIAVLSAAALQSIKSLVLWAPVASGQLWYTDWLMQNPEKASCDPRSALGTYRGVKVGAQFQAEFAAMDASKALEQLNEVPLLHIHGEEDSILSLSHQQSYTERRKAASASTRFLTLPDAEHLLGLSAFFPKVLEETIHWYQKHL